MTRRLASAIVITLAMACACASTAAAAPVLSVKKAQRLAAKKADEIRRGMLDDGAKTSAVRACGRKGSRTVECVITVVGYDQEDDFVWKCWMPVTVRAPAHASGRHGRYRVGWGSPVCA